MASSRIDPSWIRDRTEEIVRGVFTSTTLSYNPAAQWLIRFLDQQDIPCRVVNLGAGVKKIVVAEKVCPHCGGKGYLK